MWCAPFPTSVAKSFLYQENILDDFPNYMCPSSYDFSTGAIFVVPDLKLMLYRLQSYIQIEYTVDFINFRGKDVDDLDMLDRGITFIKSYVYISVGIT